jgi:hypothetical protein
MGPSSAGEAVVSASDTVLTVDPETDTCNPYREGEMTGSEAGTRSCREILHGEGLDPGGLVIIKVAFGSEVATMAMEPRATRPHFPPEYGVPSGKKKALLPWSHVEGRMRAAPHYWVSTVSSNGSPHTRPVDGLWLDGTLYFGGSPETGWRRNLASNRRACVNLSESGGAAVILHGTVGVVRPDGALAVRLAEASNEKYRFGQSSKEYEGKQVLAFYPRVAFAWTTLNVDATRFDGFERERESESESESESEDS